MGQSTWVTGEHSGSELAKKVGLIVNNADLGSVPIAKDDPGHFKYYRTGLLTTDVVKVYIADADDKELDKADVPISAENNNEEE